MIVQIYFVDYDLSNMRCRLNLKQVYKSQWYIAKNNIPRHFFKLSSEAVRRLVLCELFRIMWIIEWVSWLVYETSLQKFLLKFFVIIQRSL